MTTRGCAELGVGSAIRRCVFASCESDVRSRWYDLPVCRSSWAGAGSIRRRGAEVSSVACMRRTGMTTRSYAKSGVGSASLDVGSDVRLDVGASGSIGRRCVGSRSGGSGNRLRRGGPGNIGIPVNSSLYLAIKSKVFSSCLILYHLSHSGLYPFYLTRYSIDILRPVRNVRLFSRRSILKDFKVGVSPSIKILLE